MIQANELRIGNLYQDEQGFWYKIRMLDYDARVDAYFSDGIATNAMLPISLSEEILLKCEFIEGGNTGQNSFDWYNKKRYTINGFSLLMNYDDKTTFFEFNGITIKSIHQLQNLYFALIGKELNIQL